MTGTPYLRLTSAMWRVEKSRPMVICIRPRFISPITETSWSISSTVAWRLGTGLPA